MDFVYPERFPIKGMKPQGKAYKEAKKKDEHFLPIRLKEGWKFDPHGVTPFLQKCSGIDIDGLNVYYSLV